MIQIHQQVQLLQQLIEVVLVGERRGELLRVEHLRLQPITLGFFLVLLLRHRRQRQRTRLRGRARHHALDVVSPRQRLRGHAGDGCGVLGRDRQTVAALNHRIAASLRGEDGDGRGASDADRCEHVVLLLLLPQRLAHRDHMAPQRLEVFRNGWQRRRRHGFFVERVVVHGVVVGDHGVVLEQLLLVPAQADQRREDLQLEAHHHGLSLALPRRLRNALVDPRVELVAVARSVLVQTRHEGEELGFLGALATGDSECLFTYSASPPLNT